jgi:hypothetical protein
MALVAVVLERQEVMALIPTTAETVETALHLQFLEHLLLVAVEAVAMIMVMLEQVVAVLEVVRQVQHEWLRLVQQILAVEEAAAVAVLKQVKLVVLAS